MTQTTTILKVENREDLTDLNRELIQKILGTVNYERAFFFYEDIGKPTGAFAISLLDFCNKINTIAPKSLTFHLKRGDFENWVRDIIGDNELAHRMAKLKKSKTVFRKSTTLKNKLHVTVKDRITELQDLWNHALKCPESVVGKP